MALIRQPHDRLLIQRAKRTERSGNTIPATPLSEIFEISESGLHEVRLKKAVRLEPIAPSLGRSKKVHASSAKLKQNEQLQLFLIR
jgi:hypothetical protein